MVRRGMPINQRPAAISPPCQPWLDPCTAFWSRHQTRTEDSPMAASMVRERQMLHRMRSHHTGTGGGRAPDGEAGSARVDRDQQLVEALRRCDPESAERLAATYGDRAYRLA